MLPLLREVDRAVEARFLEIRQRLTPLEDDRIYTGWRTEPHSLGWRFRQMFSRNLGDLRGLLWPGYDSLPAEILSGQHDSAIEAAWHDAASAEHWYKHEEWYEEPLWTYI